MDLLVLIGLGWLVCMWLDQDDDDDRPLPPYSGSSTGHYGNYVHQPGSGPGSIYGGK